MLKTNENSCKGKGRTARRERDNKIIASYDSDMQRNIRVANGGHAMVPRTFPHGPGKQGRHSVTVVN